MTERWEQDFDVYLVSMDDKPASFVVDLAAAQHAPVETHPVRLVIRVPMQRPRPDGLRDASELEALGDVEDRLCDRLEEAIDAIYAGRVVHDGDTTLYFYVPEAHRKALDDLPKITGRFEPYVPQWEIADDPEWDCYTEFLAPDPFSRQSIWNRRLLEIFEQQGDRTDQPRQIDHAAWFPTAGQAGQAAALLRGAGFDTDEPDEPDEAEAPWMLQFHRVDAIGEGRLDEFCAEILEIILPLDGTYDGWGAPSVGADDA